ncbi:hypothetical protein CBS101457_005991 [Exobasidium rhododendri]|nr:hypothetical protein CBS101457_005991 [Exobasidium rhododendri]
MASRVRSSASQDGGANDPYSTTFDPASLKVIQLRALLSEHGVVVPSSARKADLIRAYEREIRSNREALQAARNKDRNIRPSAEGVTVVGATASSPILKSESNDSESESSLPPSALSRPGTPHRGRRSVSWAGDVSGPEDEEEEGGNASTFSINNPFQSPRNSLAPDSAAPRRARKSEPVSSKSLPSNKATQPRYSTSTVLRDYMDLSIASSTPARVIGSASKKIKKEVSKIANLKKEDEPDDSGMEADISRDAYDEPPSSPTLQKRKRNNAKQSALSNGDLPYDDSSEDVKTARSVVWLLIGLASISYLLWFASESRTVGYCDKDRHSNALLDRRARDWQVAHQAIEDGDEKANVTLRIPLMLRPSCLPCPPHAVCEGGSLLRCESSDFVLQNSMLTQLPLVKSLVPLSMTSSRCLPDQHKVILAADLADEIENRLRIWKGHVQCKRKPSRMDIAASKKGSSKEASDGGLLYAFPEEELFDQLKVEVGKSSILAEHPDEYFEELWKLAMDDLSALHRIGVTSRGGGDSSPASSPSSSSSYLYATRKGAGIGWQCSVRLLVDTAWQRIRMWLLLAGFLTLTGSWLRLRFRGRRSLQSRTKDLVAKTLSRLEETKRLSISTKNNTIEKDGFLSIPQLRDDILRNEAKEAERKRIWTAVSRVVEANTNVRTRQAKVKGEWSKVWEWIGTINPKAGDEDQSDKLVKRGNGRIDYAEI